MKKCVYSRGKKRSHYLTTIYGGQVGSHAELYNSFNVHFYANLPHSDTALNEWYMLTLANGNFQISKSEEPHSS